MASTLMSQADQLQQLREAVQALDPSVLLGGADDARRLPEGLARIKELLGQYRWGGPSQAQAVVNFLVYFLQRVLPAALAVEGQAFDVRPWVDVFMGPQSSTCPRWCVLVALSEALAGATAYDASWAASAASRSPADEQERRRLEGALVALSESQLALEVVVERIEGFLMASAETEAKDQGALPAMVLELVDSKDAAGTDRVLQALALLPVRLANTLRGAAPPHLAGPALFEAVAREVLRQHLTQERKGWPELWGALVHKACKMGQVEVVARVWLEETTLLRAGDGPGRRAACQALVEAIPLPSLEPFVLSSVRLLVAMTTTGKGAAGTKTPSLDEAQAVLDRDFGAALAAGTAGGALRSILVNKLLLASSSTARMLPLAAARLVVRLLVAAGPATSPGPGPATDLLRSLLSVWKERHFIQGTDMPQQEFLTAAVVAALASADKTVLESAPGLVASLLEGVGAHLESALEAVRLQGMRVGEGFAQAMGQELRFDELDGRRDLWAENEEEEEEPVVGGANPEEGSSREGGKRGEREEEDEDELQPYDLSDDEADLAPVAAPRYLRRLIELLRVKDEQDAFDKHSAALREAEALVRARPADLPDLCCVLARDLLTLESRFGMEDFAALRQGALVALVATAPDRVAPMLAQLAFDTTLAYGARLEVLDLLMEGAQDLSGVKPKVATPAARTAVPALLDATGPRVQGKRSLVMPVEGEESVGALTASKIEMRTRRWGYRRGQAPKTVRNLFGPVASRAFFRPLLNELLRSARTSSDSAAPQGGLLDVAVADRSGLALLGSGADDGLRRRLWVKDSDQALSLAKTLHALTVFVECSGQCPGTASLAEELMGLAWPLRESPFPELRRAVLLAVAGALAHVQVEQFLARGGGAGGAAALQAVTAWTTAMGELDADPTNRQLARMVVAGQPRELAALGLYTLLSET